MNITPQQIGLLILPIFIVIVAITVICLLLKLLYGQTPSREVTLGNKLRVNGSTDGLQYETLRHSHLDDDIPIEIPHLENITWKMTLKRAQTNEDSNNPTGGVNSNELPNYNVTSPSVQYAKSSCFHFNDEGTNVHDRITLSALQAKENPLVHSPISDTNHHQVPSCRPSYLIHNADEQKALYDIPSPFHVPVRPPVTKNPDPIHDTLPLHSVPFYQSPNSRIHLHSPFNTGQDTNQEVVYDYLPPNPKPVQSKAVTYSE